MAVVYLAMCTLFVIQSETNQNIRYTHQMNYIMYLFIFNLKLKLLYTQKQHDVFWSFYDEKTTTTTITIKNVLLVYLAELLSIIYKNIMHEITKYQYML